MALTEDPRDDLRWIDARLAGPNTIGQREALLEARQRTLAAIDADERRVVLCECEGHGCPECMEIDL